MKNDRLELFARQIIENEEMKVYASFPSRDQKNLILRLDHSLIEPLQEFGVRNLNNSGFVIHHFKEMSQDERLIKSRPSFEEIKEMRAEIQLYEQDRSHVTAYMKRLLDEIENIVIIPSWFHDYLHNQTSSPFFRSRAEVYDKLKEIISEHFDEIKQLDFKNKTLFACLQSIEKLIALLPSGKNEYFKRKIKEELQDIYEKIKEKVKDHFQ